MFFLCLLLPMWYVARARSLTVFDAQRAEQRYPIIGEAIGGTLPANAIVLTQIESGSVRLYGKRMTARWDFIAAARFDETVDVLRRAGYEPYLLLEDWEIPLFRNYVGGVSQYGALDWPATLEYRDLARVDLYRLADRAQHRAGAPIVTTRITYR